MSIVTFGCSPAQQTLSLVYIHILVALSHLAVLTAGSIRQDFRSLATRVLYSHAHLMALPREGGVG